MVQPHTDLIHSMANLTQSLTTLVTINRPQITYRVNLGYASRLSIPSSGATSHGQIPGIVEVDEVELDHVKLA